QYQQQQPYPPQYQQQYAQQPYPPQYQPQAPNITVNINQQPPSFLLRVVWYIFIGWWLGGWWLAFGYLCCLTGIGIPLGLVVLNRLPRVLTLRPVNRQTSVTVNGGNVTVNIGGVQQVNFLVRVVYFICLGWWLGGIWAFIGYGLCLTVLGLPLGLMMLNRLPAVLTLYKQ
ncbi:MAG TPA: YccF domain-containing protein, partial [Ktedonobacteraceae bacterium]